MGVILEAESGGDMAINWWNWRPIVELLLRGRLIDDQLAERLQINGIGAHLDRESAIAAARLADEVMAAIPPGTRVLRDGTIDTNPVESAPLSEFEERWYGVSREVLAAFSAFSADSGGFVVL